MTGPTTLWVVAGVIIRRLGWFSDQLIATGSLLVFKVALPIVLFFAASRADYAGISEKAYLLAGVVATLLVVALAEVYGRLCGLARPDRGVFVQGAYRGNLGVIGIALCASAFGAQGLALATLPVAILTILYNIIAVYLLSSALGAERSPSALFAGIVRNPLIIGISAGALCSVLGAELPATMQTLGSGFSAVALPFALLSIGASMNLRVLRDSSKLTLQVSVWKLVLSPLLTVVVALVLGVQGIELAVLFLLSAAPTAAASFVMVVAAGGNGPLAANIVVVTTLLSVLSLTLGIALLQMLGLV